MNNVIKKSYLSAIYLFLYLPIVIVICFSFNNVDHSQIWHGFTWKWYNTLLHDKSIITVSLHSLILATIASSFATFFGMIAAVALYRYRFVGKSVLDTAILILIIIPDLVLGIALLLLFSFSHFPLGFWSLLLAHISFCLPFACIIISSRLTDFNKHLIEVGRDLGASEFLLYKRLLIPLLSPSLAAAWLLSFTLSVDDVIISYFVAGPDFQILPLKIYSLAKLGVKPEINALCTILLLITILIAVFSQFLLRKKH